MAVGVMCAVLAACTPAALPPPPSSTATPASTAAATPERASEMPNPSPTDTAHEEVPDAIDRDELLVHLEALQAIADANGGDRATGTAGFDASVEYVAERLASAGHDVVRHAFAVGGQSSVSLLVEVPGRVPEVVMLGAHLDSVAGSPGLNDNGSAVAALLAIAERLPHVPQPERTIRLAFWGAEEGGPHGSSAYVAELTQDERDRIAAYLNFDMIGSVNPVRFVYAEASSAPGSDTLTRLFGAYFESRRLAWEPIDLEGDSDHGPFASAGIPTSGLFSGGIEPKTDAQAATFGGTAGVPADACSHRPCDTIENVDIGTLEEMTGAIVEVLTLLAAQGVNAP